MGIVGIGALSRFDLPCKAKFWSELAVGLGPGGLIQCILIVKTHPVVSSSEGDLELFDGADFHLGVSSQIVDGGGVVRDSNVLAELIDGEEFHGFSAWPEFYIQVHLVRPIGNRGMVNTYPSQDFGRFPIRSLGMLGDKSQTLEVGRVKFPFSLLRIDFGIPLESIRWILTVFIDPVKNRHKEPARRIPVLFQCQPGPDCKDIPECKVVVCGVISPIKPDAVHISAGFGVVISQYAGPDQAGFWGKTVFQSGVENVFSVIRSGSPGILLGAVEAC